MKTSPFLAVANFVKFDVSVSSVCSHFHWITDKNKLIIIPQQRNNYKRKRNAGPITILFLNDRKQLTVADSTDSASSCTWLYSHGVHWAIRYLPIGNFMDSFSFPVQISIFPSGVLQRNFDNRNRKVSEFNFCA